MIKNIRRISLVVILLSFCINFFLAINDRYDVNVQNDIIDNVFRMEITDNDDIFYRNFLNFKNDNYVDDSYLGYIYIPRFDIKRIIKFGTNDDVLNAGYVGMHSLSSALDSDDLIILAGHNISNVFSKLHSISIGDFIYINTKYISRKFVVYDKRIVSEYDISYLEDNRNNELLLITCTKISGERLLVFLREEL